MWNNIASGALKAVLPALRVFPLPYYGFSGASSTGLIARNFAHLSARNDPSLPPRTQMFPPVHGNRILQNVNSGLVVTSIPSRSFIKFDIRWGKKVADPQVPLRFFRLAWGGWIKKFPGLNKYVWRRNARQRRDKDHHVFVNPRRSKMFDRMVTRDYKVQKFYVDDIYEPYQKRHNSKYPYYVSREDKNYQNLSFPEISEDVLAKRRAST